MKGGIVFFPFHFIGIKTEMKGLIRLNHMRVKRHFLQKYSLKIVKMFWSIDL